MANIKSAAKRARQTVVRTEQNRAALSAIKTYTKALTAAITAGKKDESKAGLQGLSSALDKAVKSGRVHKNLANRKKSRLQKKIAALA
ncbi:MAG: 30S ribosomal protein S20 [Verrucomicrobiota bacterium]